MDQLLDPNTWLALATLTTLEIVLGVDNIVFLAIVTSRLPREERQLAYRLGLGGALITRLLLLSTLWMISKLTTPLFTLFGHAMDGHHLVLLIGGLFLMGKASQEVFESVEHPDAHDDSDETAAKPKVGLVSTIVQVMIMDIVFSLDSVITAVGIGNQLWVMALAIVIAVGVMLLFAHRIGEFVNSHPSMKVLALSFLLLIGVLLVAEGTGREVEKGYLYFAMGFSFLVELLNLRMRKRAKKPTLHAAPATTPDAPPDEPPAA
jgi:predicted tellurium resistance membrane protein TerC